MNAGVLKLNAALASLMMSKQAKACVLIIMHQDSRAEIFSALREDGVKVEDALLTAAVEMEAGRMKGEWAHVSAAPMGSAQVSAQFGNS